MWQVRSHASCTTPSVSPPRVSSLSLVLPSPCTPIPPCTPSCPPPSFALRVPGPRAQDQQIFKHIAYRSMVIQVEDSGNAIMHGSSESFLTISMAYFTTGGAQEGEIPKNLVSRVWGISSLPLSNHLNCKLCLNLGSRVQGQLLCLTGRARLHWGASSDDPPPPSFIMSREKHRKGLA